MSRAFCFASRAKTHKRAADVAFEADQRDMGRGSEVLRDLLRQRRVITATETPLPEYSIQIIGGVANNLRRIDDLIAAHVKVSGLDRIAAVDLTVMRIAMWEMLENLKDVSAIIAADEAISIVKPLSTDAAPSFVNAILDVIREDLEVPAWVYREASVVGDEPALNSEDGSALDLEDEGEEPTEEYDDAEDAPLSPKLTKLGEEGPTDKFSDEELTKLDELLGEC